MKKINDNRDSWDALLPYHLRSDHYDMAGFLNGRDTLSAIEAEELGPVVGQRILHLQCAFGLDTLSLARRGARVTGLDFSAQAIRAARMIADRVRLPATFVEGEVTEAARLAPGPFDQVFTSWGVLMWLPDLPAWAEQISKVLAPGGRLYLVDVHPVAWTFLHPSDAARVSDRPIQPYFGRGVPLTQRVQGSYAAPKADVTATQHIWRYELGTVVTALAKAGLVIEFLHEHDATDTQVLPALESCSDGLWRYPPHAVQMPLSFSLSARKPA